MNTTTTINREEVSAETLRHRALMSHILSTSSGTLASLTGFNLYKDVDHVMDSWVEFELDNPTVDGEWRTSWTRYAASTNYERTRAQIAWRHDHPDARFAHHTEATIKTEEGQL